MSCILGLTHFHLELHNSQPVTSGMFNKRINLSLPNSIPEILKKIFTFEQIIPVLKKL